MLKACRFLIIAMYVVGLGGSAVAEEAGPDKDPRLTKLLNEVPKLITDKQPAEAIKKCDVIIDRFQVHYAGSTQRVYCARSSEESLAYLLQGAAAADKGKSGNKNGAMAISSTWAEACFMKAFALQDLGQLAEAKAMLQRALELSPMNSQYLSELGSIYQREKNWPKAAEAFQSAEENAGLSPANVKSIELNRARRGVAYVFVEQGQLDEAEKKYQQCLADDPDDSRAKRELEYIRGVRAKQKAGN